MAPLPSISSAVRLHRRRGLSCGSEGTFAIDPASLLIYRHCLLVEHQEPIRPGRGEAERPRTALLHLTSEENSSSRHFIRLFLAVILSFWSFAFLFSFFFSFSSFFFFWPCVYAWWLNLKIDSRGTESGTDDCFDCVYQ